jgi:hypothetical protein
MIQNHLLQLLCLVAMEPPARLDPDHLHDREVELLRAVQPPLPGQMAARTVRARYSAGRVDGVDVPAYATSRAWTRPAAPRRSPRSPCWSATCAGPGCRSRCAPARRSPTGAARSSSTSGPRPSDLSGGGRRAGQPAAARPGPDRLELRVNLNGPGDPFRLEQAEFERSLAPQELPPTAGCCSPSSRVTRPCPSAAARPRSAGGSPSRSWPPGRRTPRPCRSTQRAQPGRLAAPTF